MARTYADLLKTRDNTEQTKPVRKNASKGGIKTPKLAARLASLQEDEVKPVTKPKSVKSKASSMKTAGKGSTPNKKKVKPRKRKQKAPLRYPRAPRQKKSIHDTPESDDEQSTPIDASKSRSVVKITTGDEVIGEILQIDSIDNESNAQPNEVDDLEIKSEPEDAEYDLAEHGGKEKRAKCKLITKRTRGKGKAKTIIDKEQWGPIPPAENQVAAKDLLDEFRDGLSDLYNFSRNSETIAGADFNTESVVLEELTPENAGCEATVEHNDEVNGGDRSNLQKDSTSQTQDIMTHQSAEQNKDNDIHISDEHESDSAIGENLNETTASEPKWPTTFSQNLQLFIDSQTTSPKQKTRNLASIVKLSRRLDVMDNENVSPTENVTQYDDGQITTSKNPGQDANNNTSIQSQCDGSTEQPTTDMNTSPDNGTILENQEGLDEQEVITTDNREDINHEKQIPNNSASSTLENFEKGNSISNAPLINESENTEEKEVSEQSVSRMALRSSTKGAKTLSIPQQQCAPSTLHTTSRSQADLENAYQVDATGKMILRSDSINNSTSTKVSHRTTNTKTATDHAQGNIISVANTTDDIYLLDECTGTFFVSQHTTSTLTTDDQNVPRTLNASNNAPHSLTGDHTTSKKVQSHTDMNSDKCTGAVTRSASRVAAVNIVNDGAIPSGSGMTNTSKKRNASEIDPKTKPNTNKKQKQLTPINNSQKDSNPPKKQSHQKRVGKNYYITESGQRRLRPGWAALQQIRKYQTQYCLLIRKKGFERFMRAIANDFTVEGSPLRFSPTAIEALQEATEAFAVDYMRSTQAAAIFRNRETITVKDMQHVAEMRGPVFSAQFSSIWKKEIDFFCRDQVRRVDAKNEAAKRKLKAAKRYKKITKS